MRSTQKRHFSLPRRHDRHGALEGGIHGPGKLDYGNSPRATPLIDKGKVYLLGAFGDLHCVNLADGSVVWKKNIVREYNAKLVAGGFAHRRCWSTAA